MTDTSKTITLVTVALNAVALAAACALASTAASAHAFLDHAVPSVGGTVRGAPAELDLAFTQNVVVALSGVTIAQSGGGGVPTAKPAVDGATPSLLHVRLARPLAPGTYLVTWHVVSVDTHPTSGTYKFTVAP